MRRLLLILAGLLLAGLATAAHAQQYPTRMIRIIVPYPAGGATDILARILAEKMTSMLGQTVIVENKPGASGNLGFGYVAKADPDGYTLLMGTANMTIAPAFSTNLPYDTLKDFAPVASVVSSQNLLVIRPDLPIKNVKELIAYAKANPGKLNFGSSGIGTPLLSIELLKSLAGLDMVHVPYKGDTPALQDLMAGQIDLYCSTVTAEVPYVRAGKLRALGVTSKQRAASLPDVPTIAEAGVADYELASWYGILAPAGTPRPIVDKLHDVIAKIVAMPDVTAKIIEGGSDPMVLTPDAFMDRVRADVAKFAKLVKTANIKVDP
ncbi:MAG: Bug family tripartite tricarboxylate transporter substrate binding protein [Pseudomonadota bacterium]